MKSFPELRTLYTPLQPDVKQREHHVDYAEFYPAPELQKFIYCYWQFKTNMPLDCTFTHLIVADGCIDIYFDLNEPDDSYIMGIQ